MTFNGRNIVITGGSVGIGFEVIKQFLDRGADNIAVFDLFNTNNAVETLNAEYPKQKVEFIKTDVTDQENLKRSFQEALAKFKFIDVVVGNAGILDEAHPHKTIQVNLLGVMNTTYAAIDAMSTTGSGRGGIVCNIASVAGLDPIFSIPAYVASKHGVIGFTRCLADDFHYKKHGIKFIMICPGFTDTRILHDLDNKLVAKDSMDGTIELTEKMPFQTPDIVGKWAVEAIALQKNGSIWMIDDGVSSEITLTKYWNKS